MSRDAAPTTTTAGGGREAGAGGSVTVLRSGPAEGRPYTCGPSLPHPIGAGVFFYELHEGDEEIFSDVLLVRDDEMDPDEFFELVQSIRRRVQDTYEDDTLIEAIAVELERDHGFTFVTDDRLAAAVNVSVEDAENFLVAVGRDDDEDDERGADYRAILAEFDPEGDGRPN